MSAADNHKIAAQRHENSDRRIMPSRLRRLVLVERRLRIRPQEVFFFWSPHALAFGSEADSTTEIPICQNETRNKWELYT